MDGGAWYAVVQEVAKSRTRLNDFTFTSMHCMYQYFIVNHAAATAKSLQSCPTLSDPMDCSLPGSSVHEIFQARVLEWVAIAFPMVWV